MPYIPYTPSSSAPLDWTTAVLLLVIPLAIIGIAAGIAILISHRHGDQHRHGHQH